MVFRSGSLQTYGGESPEKLILRPGDVYVSLKDVTQAGDLLGAVSGAPRIYESGCRPRVMRRILIDYARARGRDKSGGGAIHVPLEDTLDLPTAQAVDLLALEEALTRLEALNERQCRVVESRCFAGMSVEETATALGTSPATVKRDWAFSRAWLNRQLGNRLTGPDAAER